MSPPTKARLNKTLVDGLPHTGQRYDVKDTEERGLMLRVGVRDKTWAFNVERYGRTYKRSLGHWPEVTVTKARDAAREMKTAIRTGQIDRPTTPLPTTLGALLDFYVERSVLAPRTLRDIEALRRRYTTKHEALPLREVTKPKIADILDPITSASQHNQVRAYLKAAFNLLAEREDVINPVRIKPRKVEARDDVITDLPAWWVQTNALDNDVFRLARAFTLLSGMRGGEARAIRKEWIQSDRISLPRLKAGRPFVLPLGRRLGEVVAEAQFYSPAISPYIFAGPSPSKHVSQKAGNGHECRRTFYSTAVAIGVPDIVRKRLMDHSLDKVEAAYFKDQITWDRLVQEQDRIGQALAFEGKRE